MPAAKERARKNAALKANKTAKRAPPKPAKRGYEPEAHKSAAAKSLSAQ